ncbi:tetratricopeptide repeat protein 23-like isoform X2 [Xenopus laevis]|uniref:Tetratricopeptide repeat protein 23-like n=2 Tax=Xenopus laevis TaxID=8355 RepID=A0A974E3J7_XENLA|nr:tetratricopeptide repeat protein 23-like isoform X2 [Xenopus laevis]OCU02611.1 hypothetical protein XELAEV_18008375mg [Xenopus laevis]
MKPIYIPTDSSYTADTGSRCSTARPASVLSVPSKLDENISSRSGESYAGIKKFSRYSDPDSPPAEKLAKAQIMAEHFMKENKGRKANCELIQCVALSRIVYGDGHWRLAQAFANLAYSYLTLRALPAQARAHAESAKNILLRGVDMSKSAEEKREIMGTLVTIYYTLGMAHVMQNNGKESYLSLQKVEKIIDELEDIQERKAITLKVSEKDISLALGQACLLQNKPSSAINYFEQAADFIISSKGDSASELIGLYQDMARAEFMRKKPNGAIEHLLQAHSISQANYRSNSTEAAQSGLQLAKAYAASDYHEAAHRYFTESLSAYQSVAGPDDPRTLSACVEFSKWLVQIGKKQEAYKLLQGAVGTDTEFNEELAEILSIMGSICLADGKIQKGYKLLKRCLDIQAAVYGSQHSKTKGTQHLLTTLKRSGVVGD